MKKFTTLLSLLFLACGLFAQAPEKMSYQAVIRNASGVLVGNQTVGMRISILEGSAAGTAVYVETQTPLTNVNGLATLEVGGGTIVTGTIAGIDWGSNNYWIKTETDPAGGTSYTITGTSQLLSVPYALHSGSVSLSGTTDYLTKFTGGSTVGNSQIVDNGTNIGIGVTSPTSKLQIESGNTSPSQGILRVENTAAPGSMNDAIAVHGISKVDDFYGTGGLFEGGWHGVFGSVHPTGASSYAGVLGEVIGGTGNNYGVFGNSDQVGVFAEASGNGVPITSYYGPSFPETAGSYSHSIGGSINQAIAYGAVGQSIGGATKYNVGVHGYAKDATGTGSKNWGVLGISDDAISALGVYGLGDGATISRGLEGDVLGGGPQMGIFTYVSGLTPSDYAGYFSGQIYATTASSGIKSFKIDHPLDPLNKYLYHSSVESNEMLNVYSGNITTDGNGIAIVELPSYFEALNMEFRYQLTCIGQFAQAIVKEEVQENKFVLQTDKPNVKVSWQVSGVRHDATANTYRIVNEVEKPECEKGKYIVPEAYGVSRLKGAHEPMIVEKGVPTQIVPDRSAKSVLHK